MEFSILTRESVKPSSSNLALRLVAEPLKLNLLDQLTPTSYTPFTFFYPNIDNNLKNKTSHISNRLKWSLSETLSLFYPSSGRVRENFAIHDFHQGIPFVETRVKCRMSDFLTDDGDTIMASLNNFLTFRTFSKAPEAGPQITAQLNVFECGGIALGLCFSHKTHDGGTVSAFLKTWAAINANREVHKLIAPDYSEGPLTFPPVEAMPKKYTEMTERLWFRKLGSPMTRRFVFSSGSVAKLRAEAKSEKVEYPTRAEALLAFIWKSITRCGVESSMLTQSVNLRRLTRPRLSKQSFGNLVLFSNAKSVSTGGCSGGQEPGLAELASMVRDGVAEINTEYVQKLSGVEGSEAIFKFYDMQDEVEDGDTEVLNFSCWQGFGYSTTDFGWGPAVWLGLSSAETSWRNLGYNTVPYCSNSFVIVENAADRNALDAWMTLEEDLMASLERDPEFLQFASPRYAILPQMSAHRLL
ncbi:Stemmadenine O-acetyltransferase [Linum grandiflorum]